MRKLLALLFMQLAFLQIAIRKIEAAKDESVSSYYDPELQDGIPVLSAKSLAPMMKWRQADTMRDESRAKRRSSDADLDDGLEDDDEDDREEYNRAGSNNHDSYENPAFGESRRAAKDGDDIENFFDKHLGPPQDSMEENGSGTSEVPINQMVTQPGSSEYDDQYEAAASSLSPLSSILHSIISAHKRPLVITAHEEAGSADNQADQASPLSSPSSANYVEASPIAYFAAAAPLAASSSVSAYGEQSGATQQDDYGGVREIIISRRPASFINHLHQGYAPSLSSQRLTQQSSNDNWRGVAPILAKQRYEDQANEYVRYPVAASYAYQSERAQQAPADEEQTVSYNLSFGRSNDEADNNSPEEPQSDEPATYAPANYNRMRHSSSTLRAYNNYNYPPSYQHEPEYARNQQQYQQVMQQQSPYNGARYHKDPSESVSYGQYSSQQQQQNGENPATDWAERQQLLAKLDKQIKSSPFYRQQNELNSQQSSNNYARKAGRFVIARHPENPHNDLDTYSSFHSEVDPYKSFTSTSRIISEPVAENSAKSGSLRNPYAQLLVPSQSTGPQIARNITADGNLMTGPVELVGGDLQANDLLRNKASQSANLRVRREDIDEREGDEADDDGVWVDDDEDDDSRQQSSDVNEMSQEPEEEEAAANQQNEIDRRSVSPPGVIGGPHGYELSPDDLLVYQG